ncbi:SRPBCC family protein [Pseudocolwellia sp. HL-MZ19]|uniref:SRPBCC family protein n=1 Tax=Pseudocolwellia sp. HL-MZ19 TaxID=3400846 RepID=UPI003CE74FB8
MHIFRKLLMIVVLLISILLIAAFFVDKEYKIQRSIIIEQPNEVVFNYIKHINNHKYFIVWSDLPINTTWVFKGEDGNVGYTVFWKNENEINNAGEKEIISIEEGKRVDFEVRFLQPYKAIIPSFMTTQRLGTNSTKVSWGTYGQLNYPKNAILLFYDYGSKFNGQLDVGLTNLKNALEQSNEVK